MSRAFAQTGSRSPGRVQECSDLDGSNGPERWVAFQIDRRLTDCTVSSRA